MCGIVGYIGSKEASPILINGLRRLEYRGYDSAGVALKSNKAIRVCKEVGKVAILDKKCSDGPETIGIGHTRWATHGVPSSANAHPHTVGRVTLVHNGIIENADELRKGLEKKYNFKSQTDTEVLTALIDSEFKDSLVEAVRKSLKKVVGTFGLAVLSDNTNRELVAARRGSPLLIGIGNGEMYLASDAAAVAGHVDRIVYLEDDQLAVCAEDSYDIIDLDNNAQTAQLHDLTKDVEVAKKEGFDHFLIKEIYDQPRVLRDTMRGRVREDGSVRLGGLRMTDDELRGVKRLVLIACGTAYFSGVLAKYMLERLTGIPVTVEYGSEFRYREPALEAKDTLAIFMSQSGETADTLASLAETKRRGIRSLGLVNVVGSTLAREVDGGTYLHVGPEISVASTKAYSAMVVGLLMLGLHIASLKGVDKNTLLKGNEALQRLPLEIESVLERNDEISKIAEKLKKVTHAFYLGRGDLFPVALEGALKLMETSYVHAQPYPTGEMKHGPIALIDKDFLSVVLLPENELLYKKSISNLEEIKARRGIVLSVSSRPAPKNSDYHITIPKVSPWIEPLILNVALQLFAYHSAVLRGNDVDQPRNLAKSVTVE